MLDLVGLRRFAATAPRGEVNVGWRNITPLLTMIRLLTGGVVPLPQQR